MDGISNWTPYWSMYICLFNAPEVPCFSSSIICCVSMMEWSFTRFKSEWCECLCLPDNFKLFVLYAYPPAPLWDEWNSCKVLLLSSLGSCWMLLSMFSWPEPSRSGADPFLMSTSEGSLELDFIIPSLSTISFILGIYIAFVGTVLKPLSVLILLKSWSLSDIFISSSVNIYSLSSF